MDAKSFHTVNSSMPFWPTFLALGLVHYAVALKFAGAEMLPICVR
jgi:hypothetical protein